MSQTIEREMALTWEEFIRILPQAMGMARYHVKGRTVHVTLSGEDRLTIVLGETRERRIAAIALPVTPVRFRYSGEDPAGLQAFLERFDRYFQRGGG